MKTIAKMAKTNKHYKGIKTGRYFPALFLFLLLYVLKKIFDMLLFA